MLQTQKDTAAAPSHSYDWYVIEHIHTPERWADRRLPLEEALRLYTFLDCADKRLGVIRDGIDAVDLAIHWDGRVWLPEDHRKLERFQADPVVADAAARLRRMLDAQPIAGRVTFAGGEEWRFTDAQKYLRTVREELPFQAVTGFCCETLSDDPAVRKAADDMICDFFGEGNSRTLEDYGKSGTAMGGMKFG